MVSFSIPFYIFDLDKFPTLVKFKYSDLLSFNDYN